MDNLCNVEEIIQRKMFTVYSEGSNKEPSCCHPVAKTQDPNMVTHGES